MPSLLQKLSFYDPEVGRYFIVADDGFYWKQAKKSPEDSKVTRLLTQYGWELKHGDDMFLIFKRPRQRGELNVIRGSKRWYLDMGGNLLENTPEGEGLESLQEALDSGALGGRAMAVTACIGAEYCPQCGWDARRCTCPNKADLLDGVGDKVGGAAATAV